MEPPAIKIAGFSAQRSQLRRLHSVPARAVADPAKTAKYSVNVGAYGPKWTPNYTQKQNAATITVN